VQGTALEDAGELPKGGKVDAPLGVEDLVLGEFFGKEVLDLFLVGRGTEKGGSRIELHDLGEERDGFIPKTVPGGDGGVIRRVIAEGDSSVLKIPADRGAAGAEERAEEGEGSHFLPRPHSSQAGGASEEAEENGLGLVIGVVGEEDFGDAGLVRASLEKVVASLAGGGLEGKGFLFRESGDIAVINQGCEAMIGSEGAHEVFIAGRLGSSQAVVEVAEC